MADLFGLVVPWIIPAILLISFMMNNKIKPPTGGNPNKGISPPTISEDDMTE